MSGSFLEGGFFPAAPPALDGLTDVSTSGANDDDVLTYDAATSSWAPAAVTVPATLDDLTDVSTSGANDDDVLTYDLATNSWAPATVTVPSTLDDLTDVSTSGANDDDVLTYDLATNSWAPAAAVSALPAILAAHDTTTAAVATGLDSLAVGAGASATKKETTAIGESAVAGGDYSTAVGYNADTGTGTNNVVVGVDSYALGQRVTAVGWITTQNAIGFPNHSYCTIVGATSKSNVNGVSGQGSFGTHFGYQARTFGAGNYKTVCGPQSDAEGNQTLALGARSQPLRHNAISIKADDVLGRNNLCAYSTRLHSLTHIVQLYASTTDATPTEATSTGLAVDTGNTISRNVVLLADNKVATFHLRMQGLQGTTNDAASYIVTGAVKCIAGTASLVGANTTTAYEDDATWDCTVTTTSNQLVVTVTADAGGTTTWNGTLTLVYDG